MVVVVAVVDFNLYIIHLLVRKNQQIECIYLYFQRGDQRVSTVGRSLLGVFILAVFVFVVLASTELISWLDFLYYCSYIKLSITLIKYVPQVNSKRKKNIR